MDFFEAVEKSLSSVNSSEGLYLSETVEFNQCLDHIVHILHDSVALYKLESYSSSVFLSVSAIEEVGKTHIALYRSIINSDKKETRRDPLKDHRIKETLGSGPTIAMGGRLNEAVGNEALEEIMQLAYSGRLKQMREEAIYWDRVDGELYIPSVKFDKEFARALLLFAIESFDDGLVGCTNYSFQIDDETDLLFEQVANS